MQVLETQPIKGNLSPLELPKDEGLLDPPRKIPPITDGAIARSGVIVVSGQSHATSDFSITLNMPHGELAGFVDSVEGAIAAYGTDGAADAISSIVQGISPISSFSEATERFSQGCIANDEIKPFPSVKFSRKRGTPQDLGFITFPNDHTLPAKLYEHRERQSFKLSLVKVVRRDSYTRIPKPVKRRPKRR